MESNPFKVGNRVVYVDRATDQPDGCAGTVLAVRPDGGILVKWDDGKADSCECDGNVDYHPAGTVYRNCQGELFDPRDIQLTTRIATPREVSSYFDDNARNPGNGVSYYYSRVINGTPYAFTFVLMPNGERRHAVSRYNGYVGGPKFACAWDRVKFITVPA